MSPERWKKLEEICHAAWTLKQSERRAFLDQACGGDEELRREAEELLAADAAAREGFLQSGAFSLGMQALADEETRRTDMDPAKKKLDGRYEIIRELGEGGMGKVYQARDTHVPDRLVVVKVLQEKWLQHEWVVTRFKQEAAILAKIDDSGVVGILDAGVLPEGQPYLVMPFVEGADLSQHIKEAGSGMDFAEAAEIIKQVGHALTAAHEAGVIHRDLKPANIMVRRKTNGDLQVKVIDFGIAKVKNSAAGSTPATKFRVGTPLYMPPEQRNMQEVTPASDVYAMGMVAYEMLTGPFDQKEIPELIKNGVKEKPSARRPGLPEAVDRVIFKALSPTANKRHQSARAFGDDLARELITEITLPPPPLTPPPPSNWWLVVVLIAVLSVGLWLWFGKSDISTSRPLRPERTLTYWLTIVRQRDGKTIRAIGREMFDTGDEFRFNTTPGQAGALYLFNEGTSQNWHVLFPTPANNQENARLAALQTINTEGYVFTNQSGTEKIWVVWATRPIPLLDEIVKQSVKTKLTVSDPSQQADLRRFMSEHRTLPEISLDKDQSQVTLKGHGEILVHQLELEHKDWK